MSNPANQHEWLRQDIPHRFRAAVAGTKYLEDLLRTQIPDEKERAKTQAFCSDMAVWEGRHAAVRWLIEFVGVCADKNAEPIATKRRRGSRTHKFDTDITDFAGGSYYPLEGESAKLLAMVWLGCTQATGHPTIGSNHPSIARDRLVEATVLVSEHLNKTIYAKVGSRLKI